MSDIKNKFIEVIGSVLPITIIVLVLHITISPLEKGTLYSFFLGTILVIVGLTIFLLGIERGIEEVGHDVGNAVTKTNSFAIVITVGIILGFFISYAEPDLHILAEQVSTVTSGVVSKTLMVLSVSIGIGVMMTLGTLRILRNIKLKYMFTVVYVLIAIIALFVSSDILAISFDSSGATTGAIAVPFILALNSGVSAMKKSSLQSEADSFGLIGIASTGAILGIMVMGLFLGDGKLEGTLPDEQIAADGILAEYASQVHHVAVGSAITILPIVVTYIFFQKTVIKHKLRKVMVVMRGILLTYIGLVIFLIGVNGGFMNVGSYIGTKLAVADSKTPLLIVALLLGLTTVLAEPAAHVLTSDVENITGGSISKILVLACLSLAVGASIFMSSIRILKPEIELWMYLLPGFGLAIILSYFVPDLFVGMAFDAGGVASGPMTATFSLAFIQGIAHQVPFADVITDGFGMIAIVAMMPIVVIELLGLTYRIKLSKQRRLKIS